MVKEIVIVLFGPVGYTVATVGGGSGVVKRIPIFMHK